MESKYSVLLDKKFESFKRLLKPFRKNNIDGDVLKYLIRDDLNGMQITAVGNLIKLEKNIREINTRNSNENSN